MFRKLGFLFSLTVLGGCATAPSSLPTEVEGTQSVIRLGAPGKILVRQTFRNKRDKCHLVRDSLAVSIRHFNVGGLHTSTTCDDETGILLTQTTTVHPAGDYSLTLPRNRRRFSASPAVILVRYTNADFSSTEDSMAAGAAMLEANQKSVGEVHYHAGDQTDWIRLKGKNTAASLILMGSSDAVEADVFHLVPGSSGTRRVGSLVLGKPKTFQVSSDNVLIRVRAKELSGGSTYTLIRRDTEGTKKARVQVVDCYPVGAGMGVAILKVGQGLQVNDGVMISASDASGKRSSLGKCTITSIEGTEASCELPYSENAEWVDFRAENVFSGGGQA